MCVHLAEIIKNDQVYVPPAVPYLFFLNFSFFHFFFSLLWVYLPSDNVQRRCQFFKSLMSSGRTSNFFKTCFSPTSPGYLHVRGRLVPPLHLLLIVETEPRHKSLRHSTHIFPNTESTSLGVSPSFIYRGNKNLDTHPSNTESDSPRT